jgi:short-subunit dehydrogenase
MHLIISGASKGIGLELLKLGPKNKHNVLAVARYPELSEELKELEKKYHNLQILNLDLNQEDPHVVLANSVKDLPCVDMIINNAGVYLDDDPLSNFEKKLFD